MTTHIARREKARGMATPGKSTRLRKGTQTPDRPAPVGAGDNHGLGFLFSRSGRRCKRLIQQPPRQVPAGKSCKNSVSNAARQFVGPLVHRLIGNADCFGGGGCSAPKQFNGLGFAHAKLNHSSWLKGNYSSGGGFSSVAECRR